MEEKVTPGAFYGSAIAALSGLLLGLLLHAPWQDHSFGPQILFSSAAAAELAKPAHDPSDGDQQQPLSEDPQTGAGAERLAYLDSTYNDPGYIPPDPLPVTRLAPEKFGGEDAEVKPASAETAELDGGETADATGTPATSEAPTN